MTDTSAVNDTDTHDAVVLPTSFGQDRLWLVWKLEPDSPAYNMSAAVCLKGACDLQALQRAIATVVDRHEVLRTTFEERDGVPFQVVHDRLDVAMPLHDCSGLSQEAREAEISRRARDEARRPFDLATGPLLRTTVLKTGEEEHVLLVTLHHIVGDGWSVAIFIREVCALYTAYAVGASSPLPELPIQYADYAEWQRGRLVGERLAKLQDYWKAALGGAPAALDLPTDRPRPSVASYRGDAVPVVVDAETSRRLSTLAQGEGCTPFMLVLAAWALVLGRYGGQSDVVVGTPVANRTRVEVESLIGFFVNTLPLRISLDGVVSPRELFRRVREAALGAYGHQDLPFDRIVEILDVPRNTAMSPVFQVTLVLQNAPHEEAHLPGLTVVPLSLETGYSKFDLTLDLRDTGTQIEGTLRYATDLFERATAEQIRTHFLAALGGMVEAPDRPLARLSLLSAAERAQLLRTWNATERASDDRPVHRQFEAHASVVPDAPAVAFDGSKLSYAWVNAAANRAARRLRALGVGPDACVGVRMERSAESVIAMLAVLKAGAAYVPLDPSLPDARIAAMCEQAGVAVTITDAPEDFAGARPRAGRGICVGWLHLCADGESGANLDVAVASSNLAYVIFTSGSTGGPKGVGVEHAQLSNYVAAIGRLLALGEGAHYATVSTFAADLGHTCVFPAIAHGGCLHVIPSEQVGDADAMASYMARERVDCLKIVPSHLAALLSGRSPADVLPRRRLVLGGEASSWDLVARVRQLAPECVIRNHYGPTETTVGVLTHPIEAAPRADALTVPLGLPIDNATVYVLDRRLEPAPLGVVGEVYIGGRAVSRGYLGRPELTAERFIPDPFAIVGGGRLYVTGDRARRLRDGNIEFLGRSDFQVKVRGFRIELAEVESALAQLPGVRECVVVARAERGQAARLVAYVAGSSDLAPATLRDALRERLPEYMVPSAVVVLANLPLTPNGKVDRRALPSPDPEQSRAQDLPRDGLEQVIAEAFAGVLRRERVAVDDDFFDLGGHSLLATQLVSAIRAMTGRDLALRAVFEAPSVRALAARLAGAEGERLGRIARVDRSGPTTLSFAQERLWFLDRLEPGAATYAMPAALRLEGALVPQALRQAFSELLRRHEVLRATYLEDDRGFPRQSVSAATEFSLADLDLSALPDAEREAAVQRRAREFARIPFDLARGPLLRAELLRLGDQQHVLLVCMHHIASDGWSIGVMIRELSVLYGAFAKGAPSPLPELPIQYADFAAWQRAWISGERLEKQLAFWRDQLSGVPTALDLPTDFVRPAVPSRRGAVIAVSLTPEASESLRRWARSKGATVFMALVAGWAALLSRYSGQADVVVGTPIAGRTRTEIEGLVGFFVNTLALRVRPGSRTSADELLAQVRETTLGAYAHQDLPFEKLVESLGVPRDTSRTPLFQAMLAYQSAPRDQLAVGELRAELLRVDWESAKFDLLLTAVDGRAALELALEYATDLFEPTSIERLLSHLARLVEGMVANPGAPVSCLELLSASERRQLLEVWNEQGVAFPGEGTLHEAVEAQVARTPGALAVVDGDRSLTYAELDAEAERVAATLASRGVGAESLVGLCLGRSVNLLIGVLAVLKAGAAYVPLDPNYPRARLASTVEDARLRWLLTEHSLLAELRGLAPEPITIESSSDGGVTARAERVRPCDRQAAYVIYTSGSTGRPKGVQIEHRSAMAFLRWSSRAFSPEELRAVLFGTSVCFDLSIFEMFAPLSRGGTVVVARDSLQLRDAAERHPVTLVNTVPSAIAALLAEGQPLPPSVRTVNLAGEPLTPALAARVHAAGSVRLLNLYGPTEDTTYSTWAGVEPGASEVTIGRAIDFTRAYVLDERLQPVPIGVRGRIYLAGAGLARGYVGQPSLTAERFVPDPFGTSPGERMYDTGDVGSWRADGMLRYFGRVDHQVKVRGFRIELGEIEAALAAQPSVRECVVVAREDAPGDRRLVAYVVERDGAGAGTAALRDALRARLPEYMVPPVIVPLERLPQTPNGKVDRRALPAPDHAVGEAGAEFVPARHGLEEVVAEAFSAVLQRDRVGVNDNFFDLGGHSLLATQLISRLRMLTGRELPLRAVFEAPTVRKLAARLAEVGSEKPATIVRRDPSAAAPLSFSQERLWFLDKLEPGKATYNLPSALRLVGELDVGALRRAFQELVSRHESLRTTFVEDGDGRPWQRVAEPRAFALAEDDLTAVPPGLREREFRARAVAFAQAPFDLSAGPLLRVSVLRLAERDHVLLVSVHHIVSDGWSVGVLVREIVALYQSNVSGKRAELPELPIQYSDYAAWQRAWLSGERLDALLSYWKRALSGAPTTLDLPTDRVRPPVMSHRGSRVALSLGAELSGRIRRLVRAHGATPFMALLAAFGALLSRHAGQREVVVGSPIAGRTRDELEGLIGFFVNTLALRIDCSGRPSAVELLKRVREVTLEAYAHQDAPFEKVVEALGLKRDVSRPPLFQAMFVLQNAPQGPMELDGLLVEPVDADAGTTKFDVTLELLDTPEEFRGVLAYNEDILDRATVERLASQLRATLEAFVAQPEREIALLSSPSRDERSRLLEEWNGGRASFGRASAVQLVWQRAGEAPESPAIVASDRQLTYAQLRREALSVAAALRADGVPPGARVGVCCGKASRLFPAILGVMHAGCVYVPMDPSLPSTRLAFLAADADLRVVLTDGPGVAAAPKSVRTLPLRALPESVPAGLETPDVVDDLQPAYVIYTSGSTGTPKGVMVHHGGLRNTAVNEAEMRRHGRQSRVLQLASIGFDASIAETFGALVAGAALCVPDRDEVTAGESLRKYIIGQGVTHATLVPSVLGTTVPEGLDGLQLVLSAGEACPPDTMRLWARGRRFINAYGPTEVTVCATAAECSADDAAASVPIGRPWKNVRIYVVDEELRLLPEGAFGELCIGGAGVALGYVNLPDRTAERFVPDPFSPEPGARMYRSGDRVRWRTDGQLEFGGRFDDQVKLRGFRIELGEVEAVLRGVPGVAEAAVALRPSPSGDVQLVGYIVAGSKTPVAGAREYLRERLPEYMVPSVLVQLERLPLSPSGKVDRGALPAPSRAAAAAPQVSARTEAERRVLRIWQDVLGVAEIGVDTNFFDAGGHSLLLVRLRSRLEEDFRRDVPVVELFRRTTVAAQAEYLEGTAPRNAGVDAERERAQRQLRAFKKPGGKK